MFKQSNFLKYKILSLSLVVLLFVTSFPLQALAPRTQLNELAEEDGPWGFFEELEYSGFSEIEDEAKDKLYKVCENAFDFFEDFKSDFNIVDELFAGNADFESILEYMNGKINGLIDTYWKQDGPDKNNDLYHQQLELADLIVALVEVQMDFPGESVALTALKDSWLEVISKITRDASFESTHTGKRIATLFEKFSTDNPRLDEWIHEWKSRGKAALENDLDVEELPVAVGNEAEAEAKIKLEEWFKDALHAFPDKFSKYLSVIKLSESEDDFAKQLSYMSRIINDLINDYWIKNAPADDSSLYRQQMQLADMMVSLVKMQMGFAGEGVKLISLNDAWATAISHIAANKSLDSISTGKMIATIFTEFGVAIVNFSMAHNEDMEDVEEDKENLDEWIKQWELTGKTALEQSIKANILLQADLLKLQGLEFVERLEIPAGLEEKKIMLRKMVVSVLTVALQKIDHEKYYNLLEVYALLGDLWERHLKQEGNESLYHLAGAKYSLIMDSSNRAVSELKKFVDQIDPFGEDSEEEEFSGTWKYALDLYMKDESLTSDSEDKNLSNTRASLPKNLAEMSEMIHLLSVEDFNKERLTKIMRVVFNHINNNWVDIFAEASEEEDSRGLETFLSSLWQKSVALGLVEDFFRMFELKSATTLFPAVEWMMNLKRSGEETIGIDPSVLNSKISIVFKSVYQSEISLRRIPVVPVGLRLQFYQLYIKYLLGDLMTHGIFEDSSSFVKLKQLIRLNVDWNPVLKEFWDSVKNNSDADEKQRWSSIIKIMSLSGLKGDDFKEIGGPTRNDLYDAHTLNYLEGLMTSPVDGGEHSRVAKAILTKLESMSSGMITSFLKNAKNEFVQKEGNVDDKITKIDNVVKHFGDKENPQLNSLRQTLIEIRRDLYLERVNHIYDQILGQNFTNVEFLAISSFVPRDYELIRNVFFKRMRQTELSPDIHLKPLGDQVLAVKDRLIELQRLKRGLLSQHFPVYSKLVDIKKECIEWIDKDAREAIKVLETQFNEKKLLFSQSALVQKPLVEQVLAVKDWLIELQGTKRGLSSQNFPNDERSQYMKKEFNKWVDKSSINAMDVLEGQFNARNSSFSQSTLVQQIEAMGLLGELGSSVSWDRIKNLYDTYFIQVSQKLSQMGHSLGKMSLTKRYEYLLRNRYQLHRQKEKYQQDAPLVGAVGSALVKLDGEWGALLRKFKKIGKSKKEKQYKKSMEKLYEIALVSEKYVEAVSNDLKESLTPDTNILLRDLLKELVERAKNYDSTRDEILEDPSDANSQFGFGGILGENLYSPAWSVMFVAASNSRGDIEADPKIKKKMKKLLSEISHILIDHRLDVKDSIDLLSSELEVDNSYRSLQTTATALKLALAPNKSVVTAILPDALITNLDASFLTAQIARVRAAVGLVEIQVHEDANLTYKEQMPFAIMNAGNRIVISRKFLNHIETHFEDNRARANKYIEHVLREELYEINQGLSGSPYNEDGTVKVDSVRFKGEVASTLYSFKGGYSEEELLAFGGVVEGWYDSIETSLQEDGYLEQKDVETLKRLKELYASLSKSIDQLTASDSLTEQTPDWEVNAETPFATDNIVNQIASITALAYSA